jgi:hypothetical protein
MARAISRAHLCRIRDLGLRDLLGRGVFARIGTTHHGMNRRVHSGGWRGV